MSSSSRPEISILTPTLDRAHYLGEAIESVRNQRGVSVEHIIIDGASTDGTPALLARYPGLQVVSEPDSGLYDALNKGLRLVRGEVVGILNSDDLYVAEIFSGILAAFADPEVGIVSGGAEIFVDEEGGSRTLRSVVREAEVALSVANMLTGVPIMNARFFRRSLIDRIGLFDLDLTIAADREWLVRATLLRPREAILPKLLYRYRQHAGSLTVHDSDRNVADYRAQHVAFAERHLRNAALRRDETAAFRRFHARESAALAVVELLRGRGRRAVHWAGRGFGANWSWPFALVQRLAGHALGF